MEALKTALGTAFTQIQTDTIAILVIALPAALGIVAVMMSIKIGIGFYKSVATSGK